VGRVVVYKSRGVDTTGDPSLIAPLLNWGLKGRGGASWLLEAGLLCIKIGRDKTGGV
jgi:hypothetical protein